jgi:hypothetical protein
MAAKVKTLFLDSDFVAELKSAKVEGGNVEIGKTYEHVIDNAIPLQLKSLTGSTPLYILKWSSLVPVKFKRVSKTISTEQAQSMIENDGFVRIESTEREERKKKPKLRSWLWRKKHKEAEIRMPQYKTVSTLEPTHYEYRKLEVVETKLGKSDIPPALLKETMDMRFLKNMKKYGEGKGGGEGVGKGKTIMVAIGSMIFGVVLFYLIFAYGGL